MTITTQTTSTASRLDTAPGRGRPRRGRLLAYVAGLLAAVGLGALLLSGPATYDPSTSGDSAYARPTPALGGQSLATYLAAHQASRLPADPS